MGLMRKLKGVAGITVAAVGFHVYQAGAFTAPATAHGAHHGTSAAIAAPAALGGTPAQNEALANQMAAAYGWAGRQVTCLDDLWIHESGFSAYAANPSSDARGIPQNISGWSAGYQSGNARQQIAWGLAYIKGRYGSPCDAWDFEMSHTPNWY